MTSAHFTDAELRCRCCCATLCTPGLLDALETFRAAVRHPVIVDSAYRCEGHNRAIGGAPHSQHVRGNAADIRVEGMTPAQLEAAARTVPAIRGIGRSDSHGFLHIDVRETPVHWCYDSHGKQTLYYPPRQI